MLQYSRFLEFLMSLETITGLGFIEEQIQIVLLFLSLYKDGLINSKDFTSS